MRAWAWSGGALAAGMLFAGALELPGLSATAILLISDLGQLVAPALAAVLCALAGRRPHQEHPRAWYFLAFGVGSWAAGQAVWSWYELVAGTEVPFPSLADVGFLLFPVAAAVGLVSRLGGQGRLVARGRDLLDGAIIAFSLLVLSWVTALGSTLSDSSGGWLSVLLSVAYPIGDVILGTLALMALARGRTHERSVLGTLALGLGFLAFADSAYVYLISSGAYDSADVVSSGWVFGFLLVAAAALVDLTERRPVVDRPAEAPDASPDAGSDEISSGLLRMLLPYVPFSAAGAAVLYNSVTDPHRPVVSLLLGVALVVMVLSRQFLAMAENRRLYVELGAARDQLEYQALHDHLTGLPNRALFNDRLDHALRRPGVDLGLLFCDLDDFKWVNDNLGHSCGDLLLREVSVRLLDCVRAGDTVARLGGDEFAILLENAEDTQQVADRVITSMLDPFDLHGTAVTMSMSLGVTHHKAPEIVGQRTADDRRTTGDEARADDDSPAAIAHTMLRDADLAMYAAKTSGKGKAVLAEA